MFSRKSMTLTRASNKQRLLTSTERRRTASRRNSLAEMRRCLFIAGDRGSGKSTTLLCKILEVIAANNSAVVVICPEPILIEQIISQTAAMGMEDRLVIDYSDPALADGRFMQYSLLQRSKAKDPLVRANQDEMFLDQFVGMSFTNRYVKDGTQNPYLWTYGQASSGIVQGIDGVPARMVRRVLVRNDRTGLWLIDNTPNREHAQVMLDLMAESARRPDIFASKAGPFHRMTGYLDSVALSACDGYSISPKQAIKDKLVVLVQVTGSSPSAARTKGISVYTAWGNGLRELYDETGEPHELLVAIDEAGPRGWVTPGLMSNIEEDRKRGFKAYIATLTIEDIPEELREQVLSLTDHLWHHMTAGTERAAQDVVNRIFDAHEVLDERERLIHDGMTEVRTTTRDTSITELPGFKKSKSKRDAEHISFQPKFKTVTDRTFKSPNVKLAEIMVEIATQRIGQFYFVGFDGVSQQTTIPPGDAWELQNEFLEPEGKTLFELKLEDVIRRVRSKPFYLPPRLWQPPTMTI